MSNSIKDSAQAFAVNQVLKYVDSNPQEAFPKLLDWADKFDKDNLYLTQRQQIRKVMEQPDSNWMRLINSLWTDIDSEVRKVFFRNFIVNASLLGSRKQVANREKYGCNIPWAILMDPTSACNLHCTGCWAAEYGNKLNLSYEELDDIINQANELGTYMFLYTGGEPMVRKNDLLRLCEAHPDCVFSAFTNGTLIDEKFADEMLRVKNFYPAISIEGFEEATDFRRGKGTYQATMRAMKILKEKKLPFGVSGCYTSKNIDSISSDEFFDPACGSGSLLLKSAKILGLKNVRQGFYGQEINITTYNLCRMNMFLHDVDYDKFDIACEDTLTAPQHWDDEPFEVIVSNAREVFGLTTRNRINKGFPGHTPLFLCPEIRAVRHRMAA